MIEFTFWFLLGLLLGIGWIGYPLGKKVGRHFGYHLGRATGIREGYQIGRISDAEKDRRRYD